jgi:hypothetical protein
MTDAAATLIADPSAAAPAPASADPAPSPAPAPADPNAAPAPAPEALTLPAKDATPEQWAAFYAKIGKPESVEGYEIKPDEGSDGSFEKEALPLFHKANLTKDQAAILHKGYNEMRTNALAQIAQQQEAEAKAAETKNIAEAAQLKQEWGDKHDEQMEYAKRAVNQFLPKDKAGDAIAALESKLGYAATIKLMHSIGKGLAEHAAPGLGQQNNGVAQKDVADSLFPTTAKK